MSTQRAPSMQRSPAGRVTLAILVVWFVLALVLPTGTAQDAVPLVVAGELVRSDPDAVYVGADGGLGRLQEPFHDRSCEILADDLDCERYAVAFVSPPQALPLVAALSTLGPEIALRLLRLAAAGALAFGVVVLWRRLAGVSARAPSIMAATTLLFTPLALISIDLGQTTPLLFASAARGVGAVDQRGSTRVFAALLWSLTVAMKAVSAAVGIVLLLQRRFAFLGVAAAALVVSGLLGLAIGGPVMVERFVEGSSAVSAQTTVNPYNGSVEAAIHQVPFVPVPVETAEIAGLVIRVGALLLGGWGLVRIKDPDAQWAFAWSLLLVVAPLVWWHYSVVLVAALAVAVSRSSDPDRWLPALPLLLLVGLPLSIANGRGWGIPSAQWAVALATTAFIWWLVAASPAAGDVDSPERSASDTT
ncbi:MAG: DUF2029 domain-containing protein [Acidimicrobiia bacterium]|nr:DUF2029 domain-containing protein [Acidimicrobiia bacterium]